MTIVAVVYITTVAEGSHLFLCVLLAVRKFYNSDDSRTAARFGSMRNAP